MYIEERYEWLVNRLKEEFPDNEVIGKAFDLGSAFAVAIKAGEKSRAARVEYNERVGGETVFDEDGSSFTKGGHWLNHSLNELSTTDKERRVQEIITAFKKVAE